MKGKILDYSIKNGNGIISGDDGKRYGFKNTDWKSDKNPNTGQTVDFTIDDSGQAIDIYLDKDSVTTDNTKIIAALLAFFLGAFGIHKFYLGCTTAGVIMLVVFLLGFVILGLPSAVIAIIALIEAILYIIKSNEEFEKIYVENQRCWF